MQELQKAEDARTAVEAQTSEVEEATTPKVPSGGAKVEKMGEAAPNPTDPKV